MDAVDSMVENKGGGLDEFDSNTKPDHETVVQANKDGIIEGMDTE